MKIAPGALGAATPLTDVEEGLLRELVRFPTGNAADALLQRGKRCGLIRGLHPFGATHAFAGPAFTLRQLPRAAGAPAGVNLTRHVDVIDQQLPAGRVMVIAAGAEADEACTLGALLAFRAKLRGAAGIVIDGQVRDLPELPEAGIPIAARGGNPLGSAFFFETHGVGEPVDVGGTTVSVDDIVFGDQTGIIVFARDLLPEVVDGCRAIAAREACWSRVLREGRSFAEAKREC